jgi:YidC/Oxa1 family membrane protein insertase
MRPRPRAAETNLNPRKLNFFMDKTGIIVVSICVVLLGWWMVKENNIAKQQAQFAATNQLANAQNNVTNLPAATPAAIATPTPAAFDTNLPEQLVVLATGQARYTFTSRGGGLKGIELLDYPETISARWKSQATNISLTTLNTRAPAPVLAVFGDPSLVGDGNFTLTRIADGVRAEKTFADGLVLEKEFHIGSNYMVTTDVVLKNTSAKPLTLPAQELTIGTSTPMDADDSGIAEGVMWYDGTKMQMDVTLPWFSGSGLSCMRGQPRPEYVAGTGNVVWVAAHNQFFTLLAMPKEAAQSIVARPVTLPQYSGIGEADNAPLPRGVQAGLVYPGMTLTANSSVDHEVTFYIGPKEYRTLADIGAKFQNHADDVMGFGTGLGAIYGFCAKPLLIAMNWLHDWTKLGYGLVIVLLTVLLRAIFWPLTAASTRSMKRMQALGPELKALQVKYKDDVQKLTSKQWELYRKHKVNPMSGCLPMLIQMPVFFGFFTMIRSAIELRGAHFLWAADLSKSDTLFMIPGLNIPFNLMPLLMGGAMLWQSHLAPASPGMDPGQQKMMRYMPLIFLVFLYNYSAGLSLYMIVSTMASVLQTKVTRNLKDPAAVPALTAAPKKPKK